MAPFLYPTSTTTHIQMYQITFYVPQSHLKHVKNAMFEAGAGKLGNYEHCAWQTAGEGQFRPLPGSQPTIGTAHKLECITEYKVEMICAKEHIQQVIAAMKTAHPYEEPAYAAIELCNNSV